MLRRVSLGVLALVVGTSSASLGQTPGSRSLGADEFRSFTTMRAPSAALSMNRVELLLRKRVAGIDWEERTFEEVLDWLRDESDGKVNIIPKWNALSIVDVDADKLVSLTLNNSTVGEVLTEVLDQLTETGDVTFHGERNSLRISTKDDFGRKLELRIYDVTDVLFRIPDFSKSAPQVDLARQSSSGGGGGGSSSQPIFRNSGGNSAQELSEKGSDDNPEQVLEDLVTLIRETIEPDSWGEIGGPGRIRGFNKRSLVVLNTVEVHEMIAGFFARHR